MTSLERTASWVIVWRAIGYPIRETFNAATADEYRKHPDLYEVVPILEWLQRVNRKARDDRP